MINEEVRKNLSVLGLKVSTELPKLKVVRAAFLRKSKEFHPDKNVNIGERKAKELEEKFKVLLQAYKELADFITQNQNEDLEKDEEEELVRKEFNEMNFININKQSVVVKIPSDHAEAWKRTLSDGFVWIVRGICVPVVFSLKILHHLHFSPFPLFFFIFLFEIIP